jgi:probable F420-dependent oxidoreductase
VKIDGGIGQELASAGRRTQAAEDAGLDCAWVAETTNDPFLSLTLAAEHSRTISIGTSVAIAFARNPMSLAYTANQLQEFSHGRVILGLGSQVRSHIERRFSATWSKPASRMREFVLAMRAIWAAWNDGTKLDFNGDFYTHSLMTPVFAPAANPYGAPRVFLAAVGPHMTEVAGEVADGVITHGVSSPRYLREVTIPAVERGLAKSGRSRAEFHITCPGFISVVDDEAKLARARDTMRNQLAYYASTPSYRGVLELHGWGDLQTDLFKLSKEGRWEAMSALIDDDVLDTFTVVTTPALLAGEVASRYGGLVDRIMTTWWRKPWAPAVNDELRHL